MSIDTEAVRVKLVETLVPAFASAHPDAKINFENQPVEQDDDNGWIYVSVIPGATNRTSIGSRQNPGSVVRYCQYGIMQVQMVIKKDAGTRKLHQFADTIINTMNDLDWSMASGRLMTLNADRRTRGVVGGSYAMNVNIEWECTATLT